MNSVLPQPPTASTPVAAAPEKASAATIATLCSILCGLGLAEQISNNILPLTLHRFTESAKVIGLILAIHPVFGFIAQPLVGVLSDRIWTPLGRRGFFLITCTPVAAACTVVMPHLSELWQLVVVVVIFQFFLALLWGSDHPLLADLIPPWQRTLTKACMMTSQQICTFLFVRYGIGYALDHYGEAVVYRFTAAGLIVLIGVAAFFLKEKRLPPSTRPKLTVRRYVTDMVGDPVLRRFGVLAFTNSTLTWVVSGYIVLFATQTARLPKAAFGEAWSKQPLIALCCAIPIALVAERMPKPWVLAIGYACQIVGCGFGFFAHTAGDFALVAVVYGFGGIVVEVTQKPFFTEYVPRDIIGQVVGSYNICYAVGRSLALAGGGWLIEHLHNDYRVIWIVGLVFGVASILLALSLPDVRFAQRRNPRA